MNPILNSIKRLAFLVMIPMLVVAFPFGILLYMIFNCKLPSKEVLKDITGLSVYTNKDESSLTEAIKRSMAHMRDEAYEYYQWPTMWHWLIDKGRVKYYEYRDQTVTHKLQRMDPRLQNIQSQITDDVLLKIKRKLETS
jgi:hypothetical protein